MIPPGQMFDVFEEGELWVMNTGSSLSVALRGAETTAVFKRLDSYLTQDSAWAARIVTRVAEVAQRKVEPGYKNPWDNCLVAYLHLLNRHDKEAAKAAARALCMPNNWYHTRSMTETILGKEYLTVDVVVEVQATHPEFELPKAMTEGAVGYDLRYLDPEGSADVPTLITLKPGERKAVPLGCRMAIPEGWMIEIAPRSGLAMKQGVTLLNGPGIVDWDYRGEFHALIHNASKEDVILSHGERVCQILVRPVPRVTFKKVEKLSNTERGEGGFGSTGK